LYDTLKKSGHDLGNETKMTEITLPEIAKEELRNLTPERRRIVLQGLQRKLWHLDRTFKLSYRYEVCPVCNGMESTLENPKCDNCYIKVACKYPFDAGFREDQEKGEKYFRGMLEFMMSDCLRLESVVVGGVWDNNGGRPSKIAEKIASYLKADLINGGNIEDLKRRVNISKYKIIIWMVNISNDEGKDYPKKNQGSVLVVSKVMRDGYTSADAAKRIFAMHGNAVIEIRKNESGRIFFRLVDALSNEWASTDDIEVLCRSIKDLSEWTSNSIRISTTREDEPVPEIPGDMDKLINIVKLIADKVEVEVGGRYFGNLSTRCMKMFPSASEKTLTFVSPRNIDKRRIEAEDMVFAWKDNDGIKYAGDRKPSVDTAIQVLLYRKFSHLKFMVHGHAYVSNCPTTDIYFPCGDLREVEEISPFINKHQEGIVNLKNHGFLIFASTIEKMEQLAREATFINRL